MRKKVNKLTFLIAGICACLFAAGLFTQPEAAAKGISDGLLLCVNVIIPSLFPFVALAAFLNKSGLTDIIGKVLSPFTLLLFHMPGATACTILMGLIGGYPVGGKMIAELYEEEKITAKQAHWLFFYCVNPGPAFAISAIGIAVLGNRKLGIILFASLAISSLLIGILTGLLNRKSPLSPACVVRKEKTGLIDAYVCSVADASASMYSVCAWVVIFSCIIALLGTLNLSEQTQSLLTCILECSRGCTALSGQNLPLIAAVLGWGGISVQCQILPYVLKTGMKPLHFMAGRLLHALTAYGIAQLLTILFPQPIQVFSNSVQAMPVFSSVSVPATVGLIVMSGLLILDIDRKEKIC